LLQIICNNIFATELISLTLQKQPMKNPNALRSLLHLNQEEISLLLGVSRGHWSMFEINKRSLPPQASQTLFELLAHLQSPKAAKALTQAAAQKQKQAESRQLAKLLRENQYQQLLLNKNIADAQKKQSAQIHLSLLLDHYKNHPPKDTKDSAPSLYDKLKSLQTPNDYAAKLLQYEIKLQTLQFQQQLLESKIKDL